MSGNSPPPVGSYPPVGPPVPIPYSEKVKSRIQRSERLQRNVLEVNLDFDGPQVKVEKDEVGKLFAKMGIDVRSQVEGYQIKNKKVFAWFKLNLNIEKFCRDECFKVKDGVKTGVIKPMDRKDVAVSVRGLDLNTPDTLVMEYLNKFGRVTKNDVVYDIEKEGLLKGLKNGDRKYIVDFTDGTNMGTFHILDGAHIQVSYSG